MAKSKRARRRKGAGRRGGPPARRRPLSETERELERAVAEMQHRAAEAHAPDTPPRRIATILVEDFEDLPAPVGFAQTLSDQDPQRARAVAAEIERLAPGSLVTLTFAAEVAREVDGDPDRSVALLEESFDACVDPVAAGAMGLHLLGAGMTLEALDAAEQSLLDDPGDEAGQELLAAALGQLHDRAQAGERLERPERQALERFADRGLMYRLRDSMRTFVEERPELQELIALSIREWLEELEQEEMISQGEITEAGPSDLRERYDGCERLALERAWLREPEDDDEPGAEAEPDLEHSTAPLARLAADQGAPREIARAARDWLQTCTYGLWLVSDPIPSPGVWLTDIVSGVRRYAAIPPEQLAAASPWSVLMGALVAIDGTWRSTGTVVPMRPAEGDAAAEFAREATDDLVRALTGKRVRGRAARPRTPQPHGVLAAASEPADPMLADLISKVLGNLLPAIAGQLWRRREAGPRLNNTDGHPLKFITARVRVSDPAAAAERLALHDDFEGEAPGDLTWWGRPLSEMERQSALATLRAQTGEEVVDPDEVPRWLRGRLKWLDDGCEVQVNSEERLATLLAVLGDLGLDPEVTRRSAVDTAQDMPPIPLGGPMPFAASQEAIDAWLEHWPQERIPALGQLTPRVAATRRDKRAHLEALLREFEHDAHQLAREGRPAPEIGRLRHELGMERWEN